MQASAVRAARCKLQHTVDMVQRTTCDMRRTAYNVRHAIERERVGRIWETSARSALSPWRARVREHADRAVRMACNNAPAPSYIAPARPHPAGWPRTTPTCSFAEVNPKAPSAVCARCIRYATYNMQRAAYNIATFYNIQAQYAASSAQRESQARKHPIGKMQPCSTDRVACCNRERHGTHHRPLCVKADMR